MGDENNHQRNRAKIPILQLAQQFETQAKMGHENNHQRNRAKIPNPQPFDGSAKDLNDLKKWFRRLRTFTKQHDEYLVFFEGGEFETWTCKREDKTYGISIQARAATGGPPAVEEITQDAAKRKTLSLIRDLEALLLIFSEYAPRHCDMILDQATSIQSIFDMMSTPLQLTSGTKFGDVQDGNTGEQRQGKNTQTQTQTQIEQMEKLKGENEQMKSENKKMKSENKKMTDEMKELKCEIEKMKIGNNNFTDEMEGENKKMKSENKKMFHEMKDLKGENENEKMKSENNKMTDEIEGENEKMKSENIKMKSENNKMTDEMKELKGENEEEKQAIDAIKAKVTALYCSIKSPPTQVKILHTAIISMIKSTFSQSGYELMEDGGGPTLVTVVNTLRVEADIVRDVAAAKLSSSEASKVVLLRIIPTREPNKKVEKIKSGSYELDLIFLVEQNAKNLHDCPHNTEQCQELLEYLRGSVRL